MVIIDEGDKLSQSIERHFLVPGLASKRPLILLRGKHVFMQILDTPFQEVKIIRLDVHADERGLFAETWNADFMKRLPDSPDWVQDSFSVSAKKGTVRGLHFQSPPAEQAKLVRVSRGSLLDVVVDIRQGSPTFGLSYCIVLKAGEHRQLYIATGFAHGFCTLEDDTEITYKLAGPYAPPLSGGILWNDPDLDIDWPVSEADAILSDKDRALPRLKDSPALFTYRGTAT